MAVFVGVSFSHAADAVTNQTVALSNVVAVITTPGRAGGGFGGGNNAAHRCSKLADVHKIRSQIFESAAPVEMKLNGA
jgi:hypothetical protein